VKHRVIRAGIGALVLAGCAGSGLAGSVVEGALPVTDVSLEVVNENGVGVTGGRLTLTDGTDLPLEGGVTHLDLDGPVAGVLSADGMLDQPVVIEHTSDHRITMIARTGPDGSTRRSFHFAGDTMLARRYVDGDEEGGLDLADEVVAAVDDLFAAADHSTLNLESVIGTLESSEITPGKRWAIQSVPEITNMLAALGVDLVTLGNNHVGDYEDAGVVSTLEHLERAGVSWVGAGLNQAEAIRPISYEVAGLTVSTSSFLLPDGDSNNEYLPRTGDDDFRGDDQRLEWQYETREVDLRGPESSLTGSARAGDVWDWFRENVAGDGAAFEADLWSQADDVFPELQDFGARRAHGGAALYDEESALAAIGAGVNDLRVVQFHGGFQYQTAPSRSLVEAARDAIDAGADVVIAHHPHVLGGFEYYGDGLIIWSLGNFVFDQELFATYRSGFVRMVFEEDRLLDASLLPLHLVDYRPIPSAGAAALGTAGHLSELARNDTVTVAVEGSDPAQTPRERDAGRGSVVLRDDGSIALLSFEPKPYVATIPESGLLELEADQALINPGDAKFEIGRDLFGWGSFDQTMADGNIDRAPMWDMDGAAGFSWNTRESDGHLVFDPATASIGRVRTRSRIPLAPSRYVDASGRALQSMPRIEVTLSTAASWLTEFEVRLDSYHFSDRNPARYPVNELLSSREYEVTIGRAQSIDVSLDVPKDQLLDPETGLEATALMLYLENPATRLGTLEVDDVAVIEWRPANEFLFDAVIAADFVTGPPGSEVHLIDLRG
jgi:poly-gamma-glutamate capsule biosynthesis protein CapA/YwtB (metallophosphatase superfamily)